VVCALRMNCPLVRGGARSGVVNGLIRSLSAFRRDSSPTPAVARTPAQVTGDRRSVVGHVEMRALADVLRPLNRERLFLELVSE
jgi:hypothetical protein